MFAMLLEMQCKDTIKKAFFQMFSSGRITCINNPKIDVTYGNIFHRKDTAFSGFFRTFVPIQKHIKTWKILTDYRLLPMAAWSWPRPLRTLSRRTFLPLEVERIFRNLGVPTIRA